MEILLPVWFLIGMVIGTLIFRWSRRSHEPESLRQYRRARQQFQHEHPYLPQPEAPLSRPDSAAKHILRVSLGVTPLLRRVFLRGSSRNSKGSSGLSPEETSAPSTLAPGLPVGFSTTPGDPSTLSRPFVWPEPTPSGKTVVGTSGVTGISGGTTVEGVDEKLKVRIEIAEMLGYQWAQHGSGEYLLVSETFFEWAVGWTKCERPELVREPWAPTSVFEWVPNYCGDLNATRKVIRDRWPDAVIRLDPDTAWIFRTSDDFREYHFNNNNASYGRIGSWGDNGTAADAERLGRALHDLLDYEVRQK